MSIYKMDYKKVIEDGVCKELRLDRKFFDQNVYLYVSNINEKYLKFFADVSATHMLSYALSEQDFRDKALKVYRKEFDFINKNLENIKEEVIVNQFKNLETIYNRDEQLAIMSLIFFFIYKGRKYPKKSLEMIRRLSPKIDLILKKENNYKEKIKSMSNIDNKIDESIFEDYEKYKEYTIGTVAKIKEKGIIEPFRNYDHSICFGRKEFDFIYFYIFIDSYVSKLENYSIAFSSEVDYLSFIGRSIMLSNNRFEIPDGFLEESTGCINGEDAEELDSNSSNVHLEVSGSESIEYLTFGSISIKIPNRIHFMGILDKLQAEIIKSLEDERDDLEKVTKNTIDKIIDEINELQIIPTDKKFDFLMKGTDEVFLNAAQENQDKVKLLIDSLYTVRKFDEVMIGNITNDNKKTKELLYFPLKKIDWRKIALEVDLSRKVSDISERLSDYDDLKSHDIILNFDLFTCLNLTLTSVLNIFTSHNEPIKKSKNLNKIKEKQKNADKKQVEILKNELSKQEKDIHKKEEEIQILKNKIEKLSKINSKISTDKSRIEELKKENERLKETLKNQEPIVIEINKNKNQIEPSKVLELLNDEKSSVTMVGGHQQLASKMKQWIPNLTHIESRDYNKEISDKTTILIINTAYINHPMFYRSLSRLEQIRKTHNVKLIYLNVQSTNKDNLLQIIGKQI